MNPDRTYSRSLKAGLILAIVTMLFVSVGSETRAWVKAATVQTGDALAERFSAPAIASNGNVDKRVLALYYPWYGTPHLSATWIHYEGVNISRTQKDIAGHARYPEIGPYDSTDPLVIDRHLKEARTAGIDTLVCSWWGKTDHTDKAIRLLVEHAPRHNMTVCLYVEQLSKSNDQTAAVADISYLIDTFGKKPGYLREKGRPVLFFYGRAIQALSTEAWATVLNQLNRRYAPGLIAIGNGNTQNDALLWDGVHTIDSTAQMAGLSVGQSSHILHLATAAPVLLSHRIGHISIATIAPGYDDRRANAYARIRSQLLVDRMDGKLYEALWSQALRDNPDWILINSFNQWHAGTEIEPSLELGDKYLKLTADYATRFKGK